MDKSASNKRIAVVGAGAIGCYYGAFFTKAGFSTELIARGAHLKAMQETGRLVFKSRIHGDSVIPVKAAGELSGEYDVIICAVKSQDTETVCADAVKHLKKNGYAVSFQNGVENPALLEKYFGKDRVLAASLYIGVWIESPGVLKHSAFGSITFGAFSDESKEKEADFADILAASHLKYDIAESMKYILWKKLIWNIAYNPLSALLESTCGKMAKDSEVFSLMVKMVKETLAAARMEGVEIPEEEWMPLIAHKDSLDDYKTSMLIDIQKNRQPELDGILMPVISRLEAAGKSAPYCETVYRSLKFKYGRIFVYTPRIAADVIVRKGDYVLLVERKYEPKGWAIPGGFVEYGEKTEDAAVRELIEETGIKADSITLLGIYSDPSRDKRGHVASAVYYTESNAEPVAGDDAKTAKFFPLDALPSDLAFDHAKILADYIKVKPV
ncbi:2-dehydropantoate 2-reductase [Geovibrio thiophilus]|uniref:2-dehydropantoate 2-reductase n=1 Tax=Geovibrio thiophilus TaxID=139438 RepID=A0A3R5UU56_9BACT|nr:2-dehydropantoate 2-reductase [Geovibrio thiophilus]QAR32533.1 2-dehydropantoate 2-reductase [Geovibrio thiophilus]